MREIHKYSSTEDIITQRDLWQISGCGREQEAASATTISCETNGITPQAGNSGIIPTQFRLRSVAVAISSDPQA